MRATRINNNTGVTSTNIQVKFNINQSDLIDTVMLMLELNRKITKSNVEEFLRNCLWSSGYSFNDEVIVNDYKETREKAEELVLKLFPDFKIK